VGVLVNRSDIWTLAQPTPKILRSAHDDKAKRFRNEGELVLAVPKNSRPRAPGSQLFQEVVTIDELAAPYLLDRIRELPLLGQ